MTERHKRDPSYRKAKTEGYRARSAYKLIEIQKKFNIFKRAFYIVDLGSSPGSWLQVAKSQAEENLLKYQDNYYCRDHYKIIGVDLKNITSIKGVEILRMDFTNPIFLEKVNSYFLNEKIDLLLSDASIKKIGNKFSDHIKQIKLCHKILEISQILKKKGNLVIKLFRGSDFKDFYDDMRKNFQYVKAFKPKASYKKSNEIYIVGIKKK